MPADNSTFQLTSSELLSLASERIVRRGMAYARAGRVKDLVQSRRHLEARVLGREKVPYLVSVEHDGEELLPTCTCPFDWEPFCKHAIAVLAVSSGLTGAARKETDSSGYQQLVQEELEVRARRAVKEGFRMRSLQGDGLLGTFAVSSPSQKSYQVEIRSLSERINRCSCLDFSTSMLGTCKHIEAVLAKSRKRAPRKFSRALGQAPQVAQLLVDHSDAPRIRLILPPRPGAALAALAREHFDDEGYLSVDPESGLAGLLARARGLRNLVVYSDVIEHSRRVAEERKAAARRQQVQRQVLEHGTRIPGIGVRLYPYQVEGAAFLASRGRALLGDDMGLGKTVQALAATSVLRQRQEAQRALVVCPASLKHQWADELIHFCGLQAVVVGGPLARRLEQYRARAPFTIVNYEVVLRDARALAELEPDLLILDEAQRIKNWRTKTAEAIKAIRTPFAFVLTGTPLQNRLDDLYSIMQVVDRRVLGPLWAFNERFVVREEGRNRIESYRNLDELRRRLAPVLLRREKEEVKLQLPKRIQSRLAVKLTGLQRDLMNDAVAAAARLASTAERRPLTPEEEKRLFAAMQRARMACNAAGLVDKKTEGAPKLDELDELLRELCLERERKVVVFSEWERFLRMAVHRARALGVGYVQFHGGIPVPRRGALIQRFRDDPECRLFFSTDAGGVGLNLQFASTLINLELPWNPAVLEQRIGRLHRHGQTEPVHVLLLLSESSFESAIELVLQNKRALFEAALNASSEVDTVQAPSGCLLVVRSALHALEDLLPEKEPVLEQGQEHESAACPSPSPKEPLDPGAEVHPPSDLAAPRSPLPGSRAPIPEHGAGATLSTSSEAMPEAVRKAADLLGPRLRRVVVLPSGRIVAGVDALDEATFAAGERTGLAMAEVAAMDGLSSLGEDSPFTGARVLLERPGGNGASLERRREERYAVARRKLHAARALAGGELAAEALDQAHAAVNETLRGLHPSGNGAEEMVPARLLYEVLVPGGLLSLEQAARISRIDGLARAYSSSTLSVPPDLLGVMMSDAEALVQELQGRV